MAQHIAKIEEIPAGLRNGVKRILFAGGEDRLPPGFEYRLKARSEMEGVFTPNVDEAVHQWSTGDFDVVVSGLHLPECVRLLQKVKTDRPDVARIVISDPGSRMFGAVAVSHQILQNPCTSDHLLNVIERACRLRAVLSDDSLRKSIGDIEKLPSAPVIYHELMEAVSRNDVSPLKIARIVEQDPAMTAKILQLVNSAYFGLPVEIGRMDRAVVYLGMDLIKNLALTTQVFGSFAKAGWRSGISFEQEQRHALAVAKVASRLLPDVELSPSAFTAGLLHDIGNLILAVTAPLGVAAVREAHRHSKRPLYQLEFEMLGVTHAQAGAYLLGLWGVPYPIVEAVAFHHNPDLTGENGFDVPTAVSLADKLVERELGIEVEIDVDHLRRLGVADKLPEWTMIARQELETRPGRQRVPELSRA